MRKRLFLLSCSVVCLLLIGVPALAGGFNDSNQSSESIQVVASIEDSSGKFVEVPAEVNYTLAKRNSQGDNLQGLLSNTNGTEEYLFDYSVDIKEKDIAKALGDGGLSWSNQVTDGSGTIKSWGMIFYQRDMMNRYLVTRMVANCRNNEVRRYSIENQDIIVACCQYGMHKPYYRHWTNWAGVGFDQYTGFTEYVAPKEVATIGAVINTPVRHNFDGTTFTLSLQFPIAVPAGVPPGR